MKRFFAAAIAGSALLTTLATPAAERPAAPAKAHFMTKAEIEAARQRLRDAAPADSYFGRMKLSYIGINNTFRDAMRMSGDSTTSSSIVNRVEQADEALRDFATRFPRDSALAQSYFLASRAHKKIWIQHNQERAAVYLKLLVSKYGTTYFGRLTKKDIAGGITEHWYATAVACATPEPTLPPTASPEPTAIPSATPAPRGKRGRATPTSTPSPTPAPTESPRPTPSPVPTPQLTSAPDGTKIVILPAACTTPAPTPSPTPTASPIPAASPMPAATLVPSPAGSPIVGPKANPAPVPVVTPVTPSQTAPVMTPIPSPSPSPRSTTSPRSR